MSFERIEFLLLLALLPVLWWLARPVQPRRTATTAHFEQWLRALARLQRRPQRFRWLRFLLLALAFTATVFATAGLQAGGRAGPRALVVLLDVSASTAAGAPRAADAARAVLAAELARVPVTVPVTLALCGGDVAIRRGSRAALLAAVPEPAGAGRVDFDALARDAAGERVAVWTITDGLGPTRAPVHGALTVVGTPAANVAITECALTDSWPLPEVRVVLAAQNFGDQPVTTALHVEGGVAALAPATLPLAPGERVTRELLLRRDRGGAVTLALRGHADALALDDAVALELPPPPAPDIAVLTDAEPSTWIDAAAAALAMETDGRVVGREAESAGFLLVDGGVFAQPAGSLRFVTFGTRPQATPLAREGVVMNPVVVDWDRNDPITAGLDLSELRIDTCLRSDFGGAGKPLIWAEHGPVAVVVDGPEHSSVHVSFRLADANFASLPAFPQFLRRCFARAYRGAAARIAPGALLDAGESSLRPLGTPQPSRPLPPFGEDGRSLAAPLLLLGLLLLALRAYT